MPDRWETILSIFDAVRHAPTAERPALLSDRCGSDGGLRAEVESLLEHDVRAEPAFLVPKEIGEFRTDQADPLIGCVVAGYTIKEAIARGGMGTVYLAEQVKPRRDVALKVLQAAFWTRSAEKRFDAESHILGYLRHTNIAQVYEAGTHRSETGATIHYFAMEYVPDARPITKYADEHSLTQKVRLELFLQLCDAVAYGHQKGVIHRDLKPANVLVGVDHIAPGDSPGAKWGRGIVKVIDFGIARTVDSDIAATTMHTEAGQLLGTLAYMSPEQCAADPSQIDATTDIYSLGMILYELLTGRMPYDVSNMTIQSAARIICEQEPRRPSTFKRSDRGSIPSPYEGEGKGGAIRAGFQPVKGDLETIILKAIEKSRAKRYQSVSDLSNDVRRLINGEPISARPPTAYSRMLRWAARHPLATPILAGLLIAGLIVVVSKRSIELIRHSPASVALTQGGLSWDRHRHRPFLHGDHAVFLSKSDEYLGEWKSTDNSAGIRCALKLDRPREGMAALIGFDCHRTDRFRGKLCIFEPDRTDPVREMFVDEATVRAMPDDWWPRPAHAKGRAYRAEDFCLAHAWTIDIFDGDRNAGDEIVACFQHERFTQGVLRIYNQNGDVLFSVWQDGGISEVGWLSAERLLVCIAPRGDRDEPAFTELNQSRHPKVIFGIRPVLGMTSNAWILPTAPPQWTGEVFKVAWYKTFCPAVFAKSWQFVPIVVSGSALPNGYLPDRFISLRLSPAEDSGIDQMPSFEVIVDAEGKISHYMPVSDTVRQMARSRPDLPKPGELQLVDWTTENFPCTQPASP
ncbi:MAG: serine/threonine-protein kinase [Planctomycetota bacterium]